MEIYFYIYLIILIFAIIVGIVRFKALNTSGKMALLLLAVTLLSEGFGEFYLSKKIHSNYPAYHFFNPLQLILIALIYYKESKLPANRHISKLIIIAAPLLGFLNVLFLQPLNRYNSNFLLFEFFAMILLSLLYCRQILEESDDTVLLKDFMFWFNCAIITFSCGSILLFGFYDRIIKSYRQLSLPLFFVRVWLNYFFYLLLLYCMILNKKKPVDAK